MINAHQLSDSNEGLNTFKCPKKCGCIEKFIGKNLLTVFPNVPPQSPFSFLHQLSQQAKELHQIRYLDDNKKIKKTLGCGKKKSIRYVNFVIENRHILRDIGLCESTCKKILLYSNNLIHRQLKYDDQSRNEITMKLRARTSISLRQLKPLQDFSKIICCKKKCTMLVEKFPNVVKSWRERTDSGQNETRRVISEMLVPSANGERNCYKFIQLITGVCRNTIRKIYSRMTSGLDLSVEHGLIRKNRHIGSSVKKKKSRKVKLNEKKTVFSAHGSVILPTNKGEISVPVRVEIPLDVSLQVQSKSLKNFEISNSNKGNNKNHIFVSSQYQPIVTPVYSTVNSCCEIIPSSMNMAPSLSLKSIPSTSQLNFSHNSLFQLNTGQAIPTCFSSNSSNFIQPTVQSLAIPMISTPSTFNNIPIHNVILKYDTQQKDTERKSVFAQAISIPSTSSNTQFYSLVSPMPSSSSLNTGYFLV